MSDRIPRWELHIRPMFHLMDNDHMGYLHDVQSVWAKRSQILGRLKARPGSMPPPGEHGPWPEEWIGLFERWIQIGEDMLGGTPPVMELSTGSNLRVLEDFGGLELSGTAQKPDGEESRAYFFAETFSEKFQKYFLYMETDPNSQGTFQDVPVFVAINRTPGLAEVHVYDSTGETRIAVPPGSA